MHINPSPNNNAQTGIVVLTYQLIGLAKFCHDYNNILLHNR